jgi:hypothetical protein
MHLQHIADRLESCTERKAAVDAMAFLTLSPGLPLPQVEEMTQEDRCDDHGVALTWEADRFYCRVEFDGSGKYSFYFKLHGIEKQGDAIDVTKGAPGPTGRDGGGGFEVEGRVVSRVTRKQAVAVRAHLIKYLLRGSDAGARRRDDGCLPLQAEQAAQGDPQADGLHRRRREVEPSLQNRYRPQNGERPLEAGSEKLNVCGGLNGSERGTRTPDPRIMIPVL